MAGPPEPDAHLVLEEGKVLAKKYRLVKPAGFGGMAQLWVAKNESTGADVCVKVLVPDASDDESVARFRREAHAAARLSHRAIVRVFDLVELDERGGVCTSGRAHALAIVMELLTGETLSDLLMKRGKLPVEEALDIAIPMVGALAHAHRANIIHRDVKPDNIFLAKDPDGTVIPKVLDFGVSKLTTPDATPLTAAGVMLGTPSFMSPEQARGALTLDARSDVFSAGIVIYMMLTGVNPFEDSSFHGAIEAILGRQPPPITDVAPELASVVMRALAKDENERYRDGTELQIALRKASGRRSTSDASIPVVRVRSDSSVSVPPVGTASVAPGDLDGGVAVAGLPQRRSRAIAIVAVAMGLAGVALIVAALRSSRDAPSPAARAAEPPPEPSPSALASAAPSAPPVALSASTVLAPEEPPSAVPADLPAPAPSATPAARPAAAVTTATAPKKDPRAEPSIARDPGF